MAGQSKHTGDIALWIEKIIKSCETPIQEVGARRMVSLFESKLILEQSEFYSYYSRKLRGLLEQKIKERIVKNGRN